jgi:hypothetical protein
MRRPTGEQPRNAGMAPVNGVEFVGNPVAGHPNRFRRQEQKSLNAARSQGCETVTFENSIPIRKETAVICTEERRSEGRGIR